MELPTHRVVLGTRDLQGPPLGQEIQMIQDLQTVLVPPLILESLATHRNQDHPAVLRTQEHPSLLWPQIQVFPWVLVVLEVQLHQAFLLCPFLLYTDKNQVAVPIRWVQENLAGQLHPVLPFAPSLPRQDYPSSLVSQDGLEHLVTQALLDVPLGPLVLLHP